MSKPLDMADKYDSTIHEMPTLPCPISVYPVGKSGLPDLSAVFEDTDDEPTIRMQVPTFANQVVVSEEEEEEFSERDEVTYPGVGLLMVITFGVAFWFLPCYYLALWLIAK